MRRNRSSLFPLHSTPRISTIFFRGFRSNKGTFNRREVRGEGHGSWKRLDAADERWRGTVWEAWVGDGGEQVNGRVKSVDSWPVNWE